MFKRIVVLAFFALLFAFSAPPARADDPPGAKLFATYCAGCHGAAGKGGFAPALGTEAFLNAHDDDAIAQLTSDGGKGKGMPAWSKSKGGSLADDQISSIVAYLRSLVSTTAPSITAASTPLTQQSSVSVESVYAQTQLAVTQSTNADGMTVLVATLKKSDESPVSGAIIAFSRSTVLGAIDLGTVKTDHLGNASLIVSEQPEGARNVAANFKGEKNLGSSAAIVTLQRPVRALSSGNINPTGIRLEVGDEPLLAPEGSLITPNPPLLPTMLFLLVVGGIWSMYAFVISQVIGIWKSGRKKVRENVLTTKAR